MIFFASSTELPALLQIDWLVEGEMVLMVSAVIVADVFEVEDTIVKRNG